MIEELYWDHPKAGPGLLSHMRVSWAVRDVDEADDCPLFSIQGMER
jgi:hypothetical protein